MCFCMCLSPGSLDPHTGTCVPPGSICPLTFHVPVYMCMNMCLAGPCACVHASARARDAPTPHPRLSAALMTLVQRKVMTNARYQRTRPMTNGRAAEQPHYAVITEDGWPGAPPPNPYPPAPVTGADQALPTREGAEPPAWPTKAGLRCPGLRAESPSSHPQ